MVKKDQFNDAIESLRGKSASIRSSLSNMKNNVIQALREENMSLKKTELKHLRPSWKVPI